MAARPSERRASRTRQINSNLINIIILTCGRHGTVFRSWPWDQTDPRKAVMLYCFTDPAGQSVFKVQTPHVENITRGLNTGWPAAPGHAWTQALGHRDQTFAGTCSSQREYLLFELLPAANCKWNDILPQEDEGKKIHWEPRRPRCWRTGGWKDDSDVLLVAKTWIQ